MSARGAGAALLLILSLGASARAIASGHGPLFAAATPTLGRGGWSVDQAWTCRAGDDAEREQMLKTMVSFGVTENLQVSGSLPLAMAHGKLQPSRIMAAMSSEREFEGLMAYRFQRRMIGIGGRQESTAYVGATAPFGERRNGIGIGPSVEAGAATGFASRAHYVWVGGALRHFFERDGGRSGDSRLATVVYGCRPPVLRTEAGRPDLRFFVEMTAEDRGADLVHGVESRTAGRSVFIGPTSLLLYKAIAVEAGVLLPVYQRVDETSVKERFRVP